MHFEPTEIIQNKFGITDQVVDIKGNQIMIRILNDDVKDKQLSSKQKLGKMYSLVVETNRYFGIPERIFYTKLENYSPIVIESPSLNEIQKRKLLDIFREYDDVFANN